MKNFLISIFQYLAAWLQGPVRPVVDDRVKDDAPPEPNTKVVEPNIAPTFDDIAATRWYMTPAMKNFLAMIRLHEAGRAGYNADYANDDRWTLTNKTFDEVYTLSRKQVVVDREASSAVGAYQFLSKTLMSLKLSLGLTGNEIFDVQFQDDLAVALMIRRGLMDFLRGDRALTSFCNQLAREWASLPVVTDVKRGSRVVLKGRSYYAGDGLNKSFHKPEAILEAVKDLRLSLAGTLPKET